MTMSLAFRGAINEDVNQVINALKKHKSVILHFEHLVPKVLIDTPQLYRAKHTDR